jgi:flagellar hook-length control protein FliK
LFVEIFTFEKLSTEHMNIAASNIVPGTPLAEPSVSSDKGRGLGFSALLDAVKSTSNTTASNSNQIDQPSDRREAPDVHEPLADNDSDARFRDRDDAQPREATSKSERPDHDKRDASAPPRENETAAKDDGPASNPADEVPVKDENEPAAEQKAAAADTTDASPTATPSVIAPVDITPVAQEIHTASTTAPITQASEQSSGSQSAGTPGTNLLVDPSDTRPVPASASSANQTPTHTSTPPAENSNASVVPPTVDAKVASLPSAASAASAASANSNDAAPPVAPPTAPQGGQTPVPASPSIVATGQTAQAPVPAPPSPTTAPGPTALDTALHAKGITPEQIPNIKISVETSSATPKALVSVATPGSAIIANNSYGSNSGTGSDAGNSTGGGATTTADVLLGAQAAAQGEFSTAVQTGLAPQVASGTPAPVTATPEALPAVGTAGLASGTLPSQNQAIAASIRPAATPTAVSDQIGMQIARAAQAGTTRFNIQLQPAELGRVDVRMELGHDGKITAMVTAERQDTLDLLQRDARGLERALQNAGLKADSNSLSFSLRNQGDGDGAFGREYASQPTGIPGNDDPETAIADASGLAALTAGMGAENSGNGRLNILV